MIFNIGYGPWQKAAFFHQICAQGKRCSQILNPNSPLVLRLWPQYLVDRGLQHATEDAVVGAAGRAAWIEDIGRTSCMNLKGVKVSPSKWMSFQQAGEMWSPVLATRALVLASLCIDKGWLVTEEDLFATTRCGAQSCGDKPDSSKSAAVQGAKAKLEALKQKTQNTLVTATRLLCDVDVLNGIRIILHGTRAQWFGFSRMVEDLTTSERCLEFAQRWSQQAWLNSLKETLECLTDVEGLSTCGFQTNVTTAEAAELGPDSPTVRYQDALAMRLGRLVDLILETRCGSLAQRSFYYPFKLAGLTSSDAAISQAMLREFELDVRAFWAAQD